MQLSAFLNDSRYAPAIAPYTQTDTEIQRGQCLRDPVRVGGHADVFNPIAGLRPAAIISVTRAGDTAQARSLIIDRPCCFAKGLKSGIGRFGKIATTRRQ